MITNDKTFSMLTHQYIGLFAGLIVSFVMFFLKDFVSLSDPAWFTASCMVLMAIWWITEAVPVAVTALIPIILFPILGINDIKSVSSSYSHPLIYMFLGGFIVAIAIQKYDLHKRIAIYILSKSGSDSRILVGFFMITSALLSMWISNTATTIMLLPMALAISKVVTDTLIDINENQKNNFNIALLLSIAYAASIGGMSTLIGTAPNAFLASFVSENYGVEISFIKWMSIGLPATLLILPLTWWILTYISLPFNFKISEECGDTIKKLRYQLGEINYEEKLVSLVFCLMAVSWAFRPVMNNWAPLADLSDTGIAIFCAMLLFIIPSSKKNKPILHWNDLHSLPWGILILFGGGLALASAIQTTGLGYAIGSALSFIPSSSLILLILLITIMIVFLTEITSNTATTATFLPIIAALAVQFNLDPMALIIPVALSASCAFMLPVATPPNAIIYSSGYLTIPMMSRVGFLLNILAILMITLISSFLVPFIFLIY